MGRGLCRCDHHVMSPDIARMRNVSHYDPRDHKHVFLTNRRQNGVEILGHEAVCRLECYLDPIRRRIPFDGSRSHPLQEPRIVISHVAHDHRCHFLYRDKEDTRLARQRVIIKFLIN